MRPSANRHVLALLRKEIGLNQTDFSEIADCSASTIQAIELGRLQLSESLATKISVATGVSTTCLLLNDINKPLRNRHERLYSKQDYELIQAENQKGIDDEDLDFWINHALCRAAEILSSAAKKSASDYRVAVYRLTTAFDALEEKYGVDKSVYPISVPTWNRKRSGAVGVVLVNKIRDKLPHGNNSGETAQTIDVHTSAFAKKRSSSRRAKTK